MKKIAVVLLCLAIIPFLVGCSSDDGETSSTPTVKTPIQLLNESTTARFEAVWTQLNAKAPASDITNLATRVGTLEGATYPDLTPYSDKDTELEGRIETLESYNVSELEALINYINLWINDYNADNISDRLTAVEVAVFGIPTPTPTGATPTPTPNTNLLKPIAITPAVGNMNVSSGSVVFQWNDCNAIEYEFWFGNNSNSMELIDTFYTDVQSFLWPCPDADTYYFWRIRAISGTSVKSSSFWFKTAP